MTSPVNIHCDIVQIHADKAGLVLVWWNNIWFHTCIIQMDEKTNCMLKMKPQIKGKGSRDLFVGFLSSLQPVRQSFMFVSFNQYYQNPRALIIRDVATTLLKLKELAIKEDDQSSAGFCWSIDGEIVSSWWKVTKPRHYWNQLSTFFAPIMQCLLDVSHRLVHKLC